MIWNIFLGLLAVIQFAGMVWACRQCGSAASDFIGWLVVVFLVVFWPVLWLAKRMDWPVQ